MWVRVEVAVKADFQDPKAEGFLRRLELSAPELRRAVRWARWVDVYWIETDLTRAQAISALSEVFWDPVTQWMMTGDLVPSAAGSKGTVADLFEAAPHRNARFFGVERRLRAGVADPVGRSAGEAIQIVCPELKNRPKVASGSLLILEGPGLDSEKISEISRGFFCNELIESWSLLEDTELRKNDRFHPDQVKHAIPRVTLRGEGRVEPVALSTLSDSALEDLSRRRLLALSLDEMRAIRDYFLRPDVKGYRAQAGLPPEPTDVEVEILAQTWSEHCKHKIFNAEVTYQEAPGATPGGTLPVVPSKIDSLFKSTVADVTRHLERPWLVSVFKDNAGTIALDEEDTISIKVETHNSPSALDPYGGALTGIVGVNRDILGTGRGALPIANLDVFCLPEPDWSGTLPDRVLHPRRTLEGVRRGVEDGGNQSGIPTVGGALFFDSSYVAKPLVFCGTLGLAPRNSGGFDNSRKDIRPGDRIVMAGGRIGKDGIHGATFSSLALDRSSPASAVQLGDPITQKRLGDFLMEARDLGLFRTLTDNGAGGLSSSVGEMAELAGGAWIDVAKAEVKYPGLKPFELVVSESQERMTLAVPPEKLAVLTDLAQRRGVELSDLGEFSQSGRFEVLFEGKRLASIELSFLHGGCPRKKLKAEWKGAPSFKNFESAGLGGELRERWLALMGRPNIASKEWLIRQYDHEVQGMSVIKPLHTAHAGRGEARSGPNDGAVLKPKLTSWVGVAVGMGLQPRLSELDPYLMAQASVDEAVRNLLCVGAEYGDRDARIALVDNFAWPDPETDPARMAALVRACYGMREAALALEIPLVSGKDSMKNNYSGQWSGKPVHLGVLPTLLMTALGRVPDVRQARSSDFKGDGSKILRLGGTRLAVVGSELHRMIEENIRAKGGTADQVRIPGQGRLPTPDWKVARALYSWLGGRSGKKASAIRALHDVSDGGTLVAVAEMALARGLGAKLQLSELELDAWASAFGEGFHTLIAEVDEAEVESVTAELRSLQIPVEVLGHTTTTGKFEIEFREHGERRTVMVETEALQREWKKEGYWE